MRPILRAALWIVAFAFAAVSFFVVGILQEEERFTHATSLLLLGERDLAESQFHQLEHSLWTGERARIGLSVCRAMQGETPGEIELDSLSDIKLAPFALPLLTSGVLRAARFESCLRLAELTERGGEPTALLYKAAALLELGEIEKAERIYSQLSGHLASTHLGARLHEALSLRSQGAQAIVRDRNGKLAGTIDSTGAFSVAAEVDSRLIPEASIRELEATEFGSGLRLSVDLELSRMAIDALEGYRGSIVLIDPSSGDVLAAVSDDRSLAGYGTPAFEQQMEPASIVKIITLSAALRSGIDADEEIAKMTCEGAIRYEGGILYCPYTAGKLRGLRHAMAISCNIAFAELGVKVGWQGMLEEFRRYGFDAQAGNPFAFGRILISSGSERRLADLAIGLEATDITPLHAALIASTLANDGMMPAPRLIAGRDGALGISPAFRTPDGGRQVIDKQWLPEVLDSLSGVSSWGGTAAGVSPPSFPVAIKTGTGGNQSRGYHINYIGIGPLPKPHIAFSVRVTNERTSPRARTAGLEVTGKLMRALDSIAVYRQWR